MSLDNTVQEIRQLLGQIRRVVSSLESDIRPLIKNTDHLVSDTAEKSIKQITKDVGELSKTVANRANQVPDSWLFYTLAAGTMLLISVVALFLVWQIGLQFSEQKLRRKAIMFAGRRNNKFSSLEDGIIHDFGEIGDVPTAMRFRQRNCSYSSATQPCPRSVSYKRATGMENGTRLPACRIRIEDSF